MTNKHYTDMITEAFEAIMMFAQSNIQQTLSPDGPVHEALLAIHEHDASLLKRLAQSLVLICTFDDVQLSKHLSLLPDSYASDRTIIATWTIPAQQAALTWESLLEGSDLNVEMQRLHSHAHAKMKASPPGKEQVVSRVTWCADMLDELVSEPLCLELICEDTPDFERVSGIVCVRCSDSTGLPSSLSDAESDLAPQASITCDYALLEKLLTGSTDVVSLFLGGGLRLRGDYTRLLSWIMQLR